MNGNTNPDSRPSTYPPDQKDFRASDKQEKQTKSIPTDNLRETIYHLDNSKSFTGRSPEDIEAETKIPQEMMFPREADILYVGDPWQKMGKELDESHGSRLTIIDYEFGEVAKFVTDEQNFRHDISQMSQRLLDEIYDEFKTAERLLNKNNINTESRFAKQKQIKWLKQFYSLIETAYKFSTFADTDDEFQKAAEAWAEARKFIEEAYKTEIEAKKDNSEKTDHSSKVKTNELAELRTQAWYDCVNGERTFRDIPDWRNIIKPKKEKLEKELKDLPEEERKKQVAIAVRGWIEEIRLKKHTEKSNVAEALFPSLPFTDESFDRFVASWSISAHVFAGLNQEGFKIFWNEVHRVLKPGGEAYIFPLNYYYYVDDILINSLKEMEQIHPDTDYVIYDEQGHPIDKRIKDPYGYGDEYTLVIYKNQTDPNRQARSFTKYPQSTAE